jgi:hypothetical protein
VYVTFRSLSTLAIGLALLATAVPASAAPLSGGTWGNAEELPGIAALNTGGTAQVDTLSCASAGNCSVGGYYTDSSDHEQAFVADETDGTWGNAEEVPGTAALNTRGFASVMSVSCTSPGNCSAGGSCRGRLHRGSQQGAALHRERDGWHLGTAELVPGSG